MDKEKMCDCYTDKCINCEREIQIHIADYCTPRENVRVYCPKCIDKLRTGVIGSKVFVDRVSRGGKWGQGEGLRKGQLVIIICNDPGAYGINLN